MNNKFILNVAIYSIFLFGLTSVYLYRITKPALFRAPIVRGWAETPSTKVEIQGKEYFLTIDLGSKLQMTLNKNILNNLKKEPYGTLQARDAKGNSHESPAYLIPKMKIGNRIFNNIVIKEDDDEHILSTILLANRSNEDVLRDHRGTIGRGLLEKMNILLDFQHSVILECKDKAKLKQMGYSLKNSVAVPFEIGRTGAIVTINTALGKTRLSLDTGSTFSFIRASLLQNSSPKQEEHGLACFHTSTFVIGNKDFGSMKLYLYELSPALRELDGILGMDFLSTHIVYINNEEKIVYFLDNLPQSNAKDPHL